MTCRSYELWYQGWCKNKTMSLSISQCLQSFFLPLLALLAVVPRVLLVLISFRSCLFNVEYFLKPIRHKTCRTDCICPRPLRYPEYRATAVYLQYRRLLFVYYGSIALTYQGTASTKLLFMTKKEYFVPRSILIS